MVLESGINYTRCKCPALSVITDSSSSLQSRECRLRDSTILASTTFKVSSGARNTNIERLLKSHAQPFADKSGFRESFGSSALADRLRSPLGFHLHCGSARLVMSTKAAHKLSPEERKKIIDAAIQGPLPSQTGYAL